MTVESGTRLCQGTDRIRMPAEWEAHQATWISWPHDPEIWPNDLQAVQEGFVQMVAALAASETVRINVQDERGEEHVRTLLERHGVRGDIRYHHILTNDEWCRDYGAIFVLRYPDTNRNEPHGQTGDPTLLATCWAFNSWGDKFPPYDDNARVAKQMAEALGVAWCEGGMVLEGGSIETNGRGILLTTESCLLNPNRNPHLTRAAIEARLREALGVTHIGWLRSGLLDDRTDGHIDNVARFVAPDTLVVPVEQDPHRKNYAVLQENLATLRTLGTQWGIPLHLIPLPTPPAMYLGEMEIPASYANFYIGNRVVLMPCFAHRHDQQAKAILQSCFPEREVIAIDARAIIPGEGAFHCLTQQVPSLHP